MARKLDRKEWHAFFERMSKALIGKEAEIEAASLALGSQIAAEWLPVFGVTYEPKDDVLEIALAGLDHLVHAPQEVSVEDGSGALTSLEVVDADGVHQIVKFREPLMLPPPAVTG